LSKSHRPDPHSNERVERDRMAEASHITLGPQIGLRPPSIAVLTTTAALGQFAGNIYAPSLPSVARAFDVTDGAVQLSMTVFFATFAVAQLVVGPVSDRIGRRPVMLAGIVVFLAGSLICAATPSFELLLVARAVQATGAAATIVMSRAVTRDSFDGVQLTRALATITIVFALVPGLTPLLGGVLEQYLGWRAPFWATVAAGVAVLLSVGLTLRETLAQRAPALKFGGVFQDYRAILHDATFRTYALAAAAVMGSLSAFFAGSPALFIGRMGMSPMEYGLYPPISVAGFMIGGLVTRWGVGRVDPRRMAALGLALLGAGAVILIVPPVLGILSRLAFAAGMVVHITGLGLFLPTAIATALQRFPTRSGAAASMQGFLQMAGATLGTLSVSLSQSVAPTLAFPATMLIFTGLAATVFVTSVPKGNSL
jgi:MFS transporter, DHA1 family, multidrug resistance protein